MVVVEFDYKEFKDFFDESKEKLLEILNEVGAPAEVEEGTGKIFVEVTPNRPDWYSIVGLSRTVRAFGKKEVKKYNVNKGEYRIIVDKKVKNIRPYTVGAVVKGLKFSDREIRDIVLLQEKLIYTLGRMVKRFGLGIYPLEKLKFPLYYTTMGPSEIKFFPLNYHKEADANEILEKHPKGQAYGHIIAAKKEYPVYLDANKKIMALIPIINSEETGKIDETTKDVFIEVTGNDVAGINQALNIIVCHLIDLGGEAYSVEVQYEKKKIITPDLGYREIKITGRQIKKILGIELKQKEIENMLLKLGYFIDMDKIYAQPYRADIISEIDVIEDVAIGYGYENFEPTVPDFFFAGKKNKKKTELDNIMQKLGFVEVVTPVLTSDKKLEEFEAKGIKVLGPKTKEYTTIRSTMFAPMFEIINKNKMAGLPQMFYEVGIVVQEMKEKQMLCLAIIDKKVEFEKVRGFLQTIFKELGKTFQLENKKYGFFDSQFSMDVLVGGHISGRGGKLSKEITKRNKLETEIFIYEIEI